MTTANLEPMARASGKMRQWLPNAIANKAAGEAAVLLAKDFHRQPEAMP